MSAGAFTLAQADPVMSAGAFTPAQADPPSHVHRHSWLPLNLDHSHPCNQKLKHSPTSSLYLTVAEKPQKQNQTSTQLRKVTRIRHTSKEEVHVCMYIYVHMSAYVSINNYISENLSHFLFINISVVNILRGGGAWLLWGGGERGGLK